MALGRGHIQPVGERAAQRLGLVGDVLSNAEAALEFAHDPAQQRGPIRAVWRGVDIVLEEERIRMRFPIALGPVGEQRGFAGTGLAQNNKRLVA